jgi:RNA polymerase sigma factor (sigma-70 family)
MRVETAVEQYGDLVIGLAWRVMRDGEEAKDIYQDTFIKYHDALNAGQKITRPKAWLCRTALNAALNRRRRLVREQSLDENAAEVWEPGTLGVAERNLLLRQVWLVAERLPAEQYKAFTLRYTDSLSFQQIAELTDSTPGAVRVMVFRALRKIRAALTGQYMCESLIKENKP